jgi:hypothetical protein
MSPDRKVKANQATGRVSTMDNKILKRVIGNGKLVTRFGQWPSFHDTEVVSIRLDRDRGEALTGPLATFVIHLFRVEVAPDHPERSNSLVTLGFRDIEFLKLSDFNNQNALIDLDISERFVERLKRSSFVVVFKMAQGTDWSFECGEIEVLSVEPFEPKWGAWAKDVY